jgi:DNA repair protein RadA/Sms
MARRAAQYVCQACGAVAGRWAGRCDACGTWNSLIEESAGGPLAAPGRKPPRRRPDTAIGLVAVEMAEIILERLSA